MLTGAISGEGSISGDRDMRSTMPRFQGDNLSRNLQLIQAFSGTASRRGITPAQLALAWLLAQGDDIAPIPGTKRTAYLTENAAAADISLGEDELAAINALFAPENIAGERYAPAGMRSLDRD